MILSAYGYAILTLFAASFCAPPQAEFFLPFFFWWKIPLLCRSIGAFCFSDQRALNHPPFFVLKVFFFFFSRAPDVPIGLS